MNVNEGGGVHVDGDGAGRRTEVETNDGTQDGNGDGSGNGAGTVEERRVCAKNPAGKSVLTNFLSVTKFYLPLNGVQHGAVVQKYKTHCMSIFQEAGETTSFHLVVFLNNILFDTNSEKNHEDTVKAPFSGSSVVAICSPIYIVVFLLVPRSSTISVIMQQGKGTIIAAKGMGRGDENGKGVS